MLRSSNVGKEKRRSLCSKSNQTTATTAGTAKFGARAISKKKVVRDESEDDGDDDDDDDDDVDERDNLRGDNSRASGAFKIDFQSGLKQDRLQTGYRHQQESDLTAHTRIDATAMKPRGEGEGKLNVPAEEKENNFARWILCNKDAATGYEDETFGLWVPITAPKKMTSHQKQEGVATEKQTLPQEAPTRHSRQDDGDMDMDMDVDMDEGPSTTLTPLSEIAKTESDPAEEELVTERPELEDMKVLPEVLNFSLLILMRASLSLYPFVTSAQARMIPLHVPWVDLGNSKNEKYTIAKRADYETKVMGDIGDALMAMHEIYEQLQRPFGHPHNQQRDLKQQFGPYHGIVVFSPNKPRRRPLEIYGGSGASGAMDKCAKVNNRWGPQSARLSTPTSPSSPLLSQHQRAYSLSSGAPPTKTSNSAIKKPKAKSNKASSFHRLKDNFNIPSLLRSLSSSSSSTNHQDEPMSSASSVRSMNAPSTRLSGDSYNQNAQLTLQVPPHSLSGSMSSNSPSRGLGSANSFSSLSKGLSAFSGFSLSRSKESRYGSGISPAEAMMQNSAYLDCNGGVDSETTAATDSSNSGEPGRPEKISCDDDDSIAANEDWSFEERKWRVDILRRQAYLRAWACRRFVDLYEYSASCMPMNVNSGCTMYSSPTMWRSEHPSLSLEPEYQHLYRIAKCLLEVQDSVIAGASATSNGSSIDRSASTFSFPNFGGNIYNPVAVPEQALARLREIILQTKTPFESLHPTYQTVTSMEAEAKNNETDKDIEKEYRKSVLRNFQYLQQQSNSISGGTSSLRLSLGPFTAQDTEALMISARSSGYRDVRNFGLQNHEIWEPLLDRLVKFDSTHRRLNADTIYQFMYRMHLDEPSVLCRSRASTYSPGLMTSPSSVSIRSASSFSSQSPTKKSLAQRFQISSSPTMPPPSGSSSSLSSMYQYQQLQQQKSPCTLTSPPQPQERIEEEQRLEFLRVIWVLEQCVVHRPDQEQALTWFRLSSSASAVKAVADHGGILPYLRALRVAGSVAAMVNGTGNNSGGNVGNGSTLSIPSSIRSRKDLSSNESHRGSTNIFKKPPQQQAYQQHHQQKQQHWHHGMDEDLDDPQQMDPAHYKDPILLLQPVTLTGYLKFLLRQMSGLLLKETTLLFVELTRPTSVPVQKKPDSGVSSGLASSTTTSSNEEKRAADTEFFSCRSPIDHSLLVRVLCLEPDRGALFLKFTRLMARILHVTPQELELEGLALARMVQVIEPNGVLDVNALGKWHVAWSSLITAFESQLAEKERQEKLHALEGRP